MTWIVLLVAMAFVLFWLVVFSIAKRKQMGRENGDL